MVKKCLGIGVAVGFIFCIGILNVEGVTRIWSAPGSGNWSTAANWSGGVAPTSIDDIVFNGTSTENCTVDSTVTVASISINSGYTGTVTQNTDVTVTGNFTQAAGTWNIGVTGNTTRFIVNGTFNKTSGNLSGYGTGRIELNGSATFSGTGFSEAYMINCSSGVNTTTVNITWPNNLSIRNTLTIGTGTITGTGKVSLIDGCQLVNSGTIDCTIRYEVSWIPFSVYSTNYKALEIVCINGPAKGTLTGNITCTSLLLYHSSQPPDTSTLDTAGYSITASSINVSSSGVGGVLKCNGSAINVSGDVTIGADRTITADSSTWNIDGTLTNNGTLNVGTSTFVLDIETERKTVATSRIQAIAKRYRGLRMVIACPGKEWGIDAQIADELKRAGIEVLVYPDAPDINCLQSFTSSDIKIYNIIIFGDNFYHLAQINPSTGEIPQIIKDKIPVLRDFLEQGGGIWFCGLGEQNWGRSSHMLNYILKELNLDAEVVGEVVKDNSDRVCKFQFMGYTWFYSKTEILPDSLTEGLKGLWHPSGITASEGSMGVVPITRLGPGWRVLVRGMSTSASYGLDLEKSALGHKLLEVPGTVKSSPVLCAVREIGKGRIVLWPTWSNFTVTGGSGGMLLDAKREGLRSDGAKLIETLLCWLAEPSQNSNTIGQLDTKKDKVLPPQYDVDGELNNWRQYGSRKYPRQYKGLIGAHSNLSDGKSSPEEMIDAAKNAGYDFIAFTEDLTKMNEEKWKKLIDICNEANASDTKFIAYPGLDLLDDAGNRGVIFGHNYWIRDDCWSKDKPGRIKYWYNLTYSADSQPNRWLPRVIIHSKTNNKRPWNQALWTFFGAYCYEAGKLIDDSFNEWRRLIGRHVFFASTGIMSIHTVRSADEIMLSAKEGLYQTYVCADDMAMILYNISGCIREEFPSYISAGPKILDFRSKAIWPGGEGIDCAIPDNDRGLLHILVQAEAGLKEVCVYDGERLVRRFIPEGNEFETFLTFHPDSCHAFSLTVTDKRGYKAVSWNAWVQVQDNVHRRCGDNWNWMMTGKGNRGAPGKNPPKPKFNLLEVTQGWTSQTMEEKKTIKQPLYECEQGKYFHGGLSAAINGYIPSGNLLVDDKPWDALYPAMTMDFATVGRYGFIVTNTIREDYVVKEPEPATVGAFAGPYSVVPSPWPADLKQYAINRRGDGATINRYQGKVTFKRKVSATDGKQVSLNLGSGNSGANILEVMNPNGSSKRQVVGDTTLTGEIPVNGYICWYDEKGDGIGGIISLSSRIRYSYNKLSQRAMIYVPSPIKPGTEVTWDMIFVSGTRETRNSNSQMEDVRAGMGIAGKPTLYRVIPRIGKVVDQKFFLTLGVEDYGFSGRIARTTEKLLPIHLPVMVKGINPNWDAGLWYRGKTELEFANYYHDNWGGFTWDAVSSYEARSNELQYIPVLDGGVGYCQVDIDKQNPDVFIGNLLVCDQPEVFITVIKAEKGKCIFEINNPTDKRLECIVRPSKGFGLTGKWQKEIILDAGESDEFEVGIE